MQDRFLLDDTIVGISTMVGRVAISIVRLSGDRAIDIVNKAFRGKDLTKASSHTIHYGHIVNTKTGDVIDEVLVSIFKAPKTYTKEDLVEINCHGGQLVTQMVFDEMVYLGARVAEAGEFTKRAFLNGRIDLTKAEAVLDVIDAENQNALKIANQGLKGEVYQNISRLREKLLKVIMQIAVNIDYPEYDDVKELTNVEIKPVLLDVLKDIELLLSNTKDAMLLKNGINTAIVGKPNVGKSSLLNALLQENRAIVTAVPGTTRDVIEAKLNIGPYVLNLIDTAGIHETEDVVEKIGVEKSNEKLQQADLILLILDGSRSLSQEDLDLWQAVQNKKHLCIINKNDLPKQLNKELFPNAIEISTFESSSINELKQAITKCMFDEDININKTIYITNARQIANLKKAQNSLNKAIEDIEADQFIDLIELSIKDAWMNLGEILGEVKDTELLDALFANFCLGK